jgi:hypothetical protein
MYDPPAYVWALTVGGPTAIAAATCIALYSGAVRAGLGRKRAALLGGAAAVGLGGWYTATALIAGHGWYNTRPTQVPWLPIAAAGPWPRCWRSPGPGSDARADGSGHGQPPGAAAHVPGDRGVLPALPGPGPPARAVRPARRHGRHRRRYRRAPGRAQARPRHRPPRRRVVQRLRPTTWPAPGCSPSTATATPNSPTPAPAPPTTLSATWSLAPCRRREPSASKTAHRSASLPPARTAPPPTRPLWHPLDARYP